MYLEWLAKFKCKIKGSGLISYSYILYLNWLKMRRKIYFNFQLVHHKDLCLDTVIHQNNSWYHNYTMQDASVWERRHWKQPWPTSRDEVITPSHTLYLIYNVSYCNDTIRGLMVARSSVKTWFVLDSYANYRYTMGPKLTLGI